MEEALLFQKKKKKLVFYSVMLAFMLLFPLVSPSLCVVLQHSKCVAGLG
ncbi:hypothetical protein CsSME_00035627 [Camellia sinensis var. sinensis]